MNIQPEEWRHNSICSLYAGKRWQRIAACPSLCPALSGLTGLLLQSEKKCIYIVFIVWAVVPKREDIVQPARRLWTYCVYSEEIMINYCELIGTFNFSTVGYLKCY